MSGTIHITPEEQTRLTVALELEAQGFIEAATWLRQSIPALRDLNWDVAKESVRTADEIARAWAVLFRTHRGSLPPVTPATQPMSHTPAPRADQIVGS